MEDKDVLCFLCQTKTSIENICPHCTQNIYYCSKSHFEAHRGLIRADENTAKEVCWPFHVKNLPLVGNALFASRDIKATEIVLEEATSTAVGPDSKTKPCCMECFSTNITNRCGDCHFPLCEKEECQRKSLHKAECPIFATIKPTPIFVPEENCLELMAVLPIRVLNLKEVNPELWQRIDLLMDHNETMKDDERLVWQKYTVDIIVNSGLRPSWTPEDIFRVIGIIGTNAVNCGMVEGTALFANFSYLSHSCVNNARFQIHPDRRIVVTALRDIPKGTEITTKYMPCTFGNTRRRSKILSSWKFECQCLRCQDVTEFGTNYDAIKCQKCPEGLVLPEKALSINSDWKCSGCEFKVNYPTVNVVLRSCEDELEEFHEPNVEFFENWIQKQSKLLSENHYLQIVLKKRLFDIYRTTKPPPEENNEENYRAFLEKQVKLGHNLLEVMNKLEPGYSLKRGRILRQLHVPNLLICKLDLKTGRISLPEFLQRTKIAVLNMKESIKCLENFAPTSSTTSSTKREDIIKKILNGFDDE